MSGTVMERCWSFNQSWARAIKIAEESYDSDSQYTGLGYKVVPRFGEFCSCCCLPLLPGLASRNLGTTF